MTRGMVGAGILSLSLAGEHDTPMARAAGQWLLNHPFRRWGETTEHGDGYLYSAFYCTQAMFQLGGDYWSDFFPPLTSTLLRHQQPDGSWPSEIDRGTEFGLTYSTAMVVLTLTTPDGLLPIFQR